jgi:hypothetical protein
LFAGKSGFRGDEGEIVEFEGEFETHVTIRADARADIDPLRIWAVRHGLSFHHIVLDRGQTPSQPMVGRRSYGRLTSALAAANTLASQLAADRFAVARIKIEASPENHDIPESDAEASSKHGSRYFEHHVKLALDSNTDIPALVGLAREHAAHLSRNALRLREDGRSERFVTQRCYRVGRLTARKCLADLLNRLKVTGYAILDVEEEFVVYDSEPGIDAGWLDP